MAETMAQKYQNAANKAYAEADDLDRKGKSAEAAKMRTVADGLQKEADDYLYGRKS